MRYIKERNEWLDHRKQDWSKGISELLTPFSDSILKMIEDLKEEYNDKSDPFKVHKSYIESIDSALNQLRDDISLVKKKETLSKLWDELTLNFTFWKEHFKNLSETLDNFGSIFKLGYEVFNVITKYNTKKIGVDYYNNLNSEELDTIRTDISNFLKTFKKDILMRVTELSADDIFQISNLEDKPDIDYSNYLGDEIRYYLQNGEENKAIISYNQDDLEDNKIRIVSKKTGEKFEIEKRELIEVIPQEKSLNQEVFDKLKKIKDDPEKLKDLNTYLDKIDENIDYKSKLSIVDIVSDIFDDISNIEFDDPKVYFTQDGKNKTLEIIEVSGVFKEESDYRVVGIHDNPINTDYVAFLTNSTLYFFDSSELSILENNDLLFGINSIIKSYKY